MPRGIPTLIMIVVLLVWTGFITVSYIQHQQLPTAVWTVPGATFALLNNKITGVRFGKKQEEDDE